MASNQVVGGSNPSGRASKSMVCSGQIGNGLYRPCARVVVVSIYLRSAEIFRTRDDTMTKAYSIAFKRLTGKNAVNPSQLGREMGIRQLNLA